MAKHSENTIFNGEVDLNDVVRTEEVELDLTFHAVTDFKKTELIPGDDRVFWVEPWKSGLGRHFGDVYVTKDFAQRTITESSFVPGDSVSVAWSTDGSVVFMGTKTGGVPGPPNYHYTTNSPEDPVAWTSVSLTGTPQHSTVTVVPGSPEVVLIISATGVFTAPVSTPATVTARQSVPSNSMPKDGTDPILVNRQDLDGNPNEVWFPSNAGGAENVFWNEYPFTSTWGSVNIDGTSIGQLNEADGLFQDPDDLDSVYVYGFTDPGNPRILKIDAATKAVGSTANENSFKPLMKVDGASRFLPNSMCKIGKWYFIAMVTTQGSYIYYTDQVNNNTWRILQAGVVGGLLTVVSDSDDRKRLINQVGADLFISSPSVGTPL